MEINEKEIKKIKIVILIPHLEKEYEVTLPNSTSGIKLKNTLIKKNPSLDMKLKSGEEFNFNFFCKGIGRYLDVEKSMYANGITNGETIIIEKDLDPG